MTQLHLFSKVSWICFFIIAVACSISISHAAQGNGAVPSLLGAKEVKLLTSWNLFGQSVLEVAPDQDSVLKVTGIVQSINPKNRIALIQDKGTSEERAYMIGDELPGGPTLKQIDNDRVIIKRRGKLHALIFETEKDLHEGDMVEFPQEVDAKKPKVQTFINRYKQGFTPGKGTKKILNPYRENAATPEEIRKKLKEYRPKANEQ